MEWDNVFDVGKPDEDAKEALDDVVYVWFPGKFRIHNDTEVFYGF